MLHRISSRLFMRVLPIFLVCLLIWAFLLTSSQASDSEKELRLPLAMEVFLKNPAAQVYELHVHLTNISQDVVMVNIRDLPWNPPNDSKWFSVFRMDGQNTSVTQYVQDWNLGSRVIQLVPGESVQETMVLNPRMSSLVDDIANFGVKLSWDCPPDSLKFVCRKDTSQTISIPKGDPGQPDTYFIDQAVCEKLEKAIHLIKIPNGHHALFLWTPESVMVDLHQVQELLYQVDDYVQQCQPSWTNSWAVSFFTEERYAGFLSDGANKQLFKQGIWQEVNIGQYSSQARMLYRFPWIKKRSDDVYMSVYRR